MGWCCSWIAVRGKEETEVLSALGMQRTGERQEAPDAPWTCTFLPRGWMIVFCSDDCDPSALKASVLQSLSMNGELVCSAAEEHVMFSSTAYWKQGVKVWEVGHDAQNGMYDLQASGQLPASFHAIRESHWSSQEAEGGERADVDLIFEIPLQLGVELTGFRHDDCPDVEEIHYDVLARKAGSTNPSNDKRPWWRRW